MDLARTVVAALDLSVCSEPALVRAATLAARLSAHLHLVHVATPSLDFERPPEAGVAALCDRLERFVADAVGFPAGEEGGEFALTFPVVSGPSVPDAVLRYAAQIEADLLVVGTRGRSGLGRLLVGSVAQACVSGAPCPVLTVPTGAESHEPSPTAPVLVAVDFSDLSRTALTAGRDLAALYGADIELVHVVRDMGPFTGLVPSVLDLGTVDAARDAATRRRVERFAGDVGAVHVALGAPSRMIAAVAASRGAGVVVMGTHGRAGLAHAILGSTAGATLQRATCAVLTVRSSTRPATPFRRPARRPAVA